MIMKMLLIFFFGIITWPIFEYTLHRFLGHVFKWNSLFKIQHTRHHLETHYFAPNFYKILAAVPVSILTFFLAGYAAKSWMLGFSFTLGFLVMYSFYEWTHYAFHMHAPKTKLGLNLRKHHFTHHFHNSKFNHGVTSTLLDHVFQTHMKVATVKVPKGLILPWLMDEKGQIKAEFSQDFVLR